MKTINIKNICSFTSVIAGLVLTLLPAKAQITYTPVGDGYADGSAAGDGGYINSLVINNTANNITFTINTSEAQASYIFYAIELQIVGQAGSGYTGFSNPFGTAVGISSGQNAVIDTYGTGATPYVYSSGWVAGSSVSYAAGGTGDTYCTITVPLSSLGLSVGNSFYFDAVSSYTSPGGQSAYMALDSTGQPAESDNSYEPWLGTNYYDSVTDPSGSKFGTSQFEYTVVPEPATCALIGLGGLVMIGRVLRRKFA